MPSTLPDTSELEKLFQRYKQTRQNSENICAPLHTEDFCVQPGDDVSPPKWHLAHTSWFFEMFLLKAYQEDYKVFHEAYNTLFNSYYNHLGERIKHFKRGDLSRPSVQEIYAYREHVDEHMRVLIEQAPEQHIREIMEITELGINHEEQHQELLLTDIKFLYSVNLLQPVYHPILEHNARTASTPEYQYLPIEGGVYEIGHNGHGFAYDNEQPVHKTFMHDFKIGSRLVTNGEYLAFIEDGGYEDFRHWLSDGWEHIKQTGWQAPLYWQQVDGDWYEFTLSGLQPLDPHAPVTHISYYEAEAYAKWAGKRLLTEMEWEVACRLFQPGSDQANLYEQGWFHPLTHEQSARETCQQLIGDAWEWTSSAYEAYPGYQPPAGALGEYNGKFMVNQKVLRGGSCATPRDHIRMTYRNFFFPPQRWQFTGIRLAE